MLIERLNSSTSVPDGLGTESGNNGGADDDASNHDSDKWDDSFLVFKEHQQQHKLATRAMIAQQ